MTTDANATVAPPLAGYVVLDLTTFLSGPFCTQILGDLGAEVIKVEPPGGDSSRNIPPHFVGEDSAYFLGVNRNKKSLSLDLKSKAGLDTVKRLIRQSDIVVENYRPGVRTRLGLDVDDLRQEQRHLIWASISGFGQHGPRAQRPAYDMIVQAMSGVMSLTGEPGRPAARLGIPAGDLVAGMYAAIGILAALAEVKRSGVGRTLDISMLDGQLSMLSYQGVYALLSGITPQPQGSGHDSIPTYRSFQGGDDRELVVTANTERMWTALCEVLGLPELTQDRRFHDGAARLTHKHELAPLLEAAFRSRPAEEWVDRLRARDVPAALIHTVPEALDAAATDDRNMVLDLQHEDGRRVRVLGDPVVFVGAAPRDHAYPPTLGEHEEELLAGRLGMTRREIEHLRADGVLPVAHNRV